MTIDIQKFILSHLIWIGIAIAAGIGFYSWKGEHDARLLAGQEQKLAEAQVKTLQQQIADRDKQTAAAVAPIIKIIHDVQTVPQAVAALPQVVNTPLPEPVVVQPNNSVLIPEPDVIPLFQQVADDKVCRPQLDTATKDLADTKGIVVQKDAEITALKKKPSFWKRVTGTAKAIGVGIGIGVMLGTKL